MCRALLVFVTLCKVIERFSFGVKNLVRLLCEINEEAIFRYVPKNPRFDLFPKNMFKEDVL